MSRRATVVVALALLFGATGLFAEAYSVPQSSRLVTGEVSLAGGKLVKFTVLEGQMLKLSDSEEGYTLGFSPTIVDEANLKVSFTVFEITEHGPDLHMLREIESIEVAQTGWVEKAHAEIKITGIEESGLSQADLEGIQAKLAVPSKLSSDFPYKPATAGGGEEYKSGCCVTCGATTACGCAVSSGCGSCCVGSCCGGTTPAGEGPANQEP